MPSEIWKSEGDGGGEVEENDDQQKGLKILN
jgi:hypothetical protein